MAARFIPNEIRDQIRHATDIIEVIGSYIQLKQLGSAWKACCPFHQEKTPSFTVSAERQSYHCFGCGKGGDVFRFVMEYEGVDFTTAAHLLAQRAHILIPENSRNGSGQRDEGPSAAECKDRLYAIHEQLTTWYQTLLRDNPDSPVAQYLATRNLDAQSLERFRIGAAPDGWDGAVNFLKRQGFTDEEIQVSGVVSVSEKSQGRFYDRFRNRLIFPIWNEQGRVIGFSSRKVVESDGGGKYINSPESPIFKKSRVLYGYYLARRAIQLHQEGAILCEGQLDVIAMHRAGFENTVAPQGTAFTIEQAQMIRRQTDRLSIALDSDSAGTEAVLRCIEIVLPLGFDVRVIRFPGGKDPDELFRNQGMEAIHGAVHSAVDFADFLLSYWGERAEMETPAGRAKIANETIKVIAKIENPIRLATYISMISERLRIPESALAATLHLLQKPDSRPQAASVTVEPPELKPVILTPEMRRAQMAESVLLPLILEYEPAAKMAAAQVSHAILSQTPTGFAIEEIIQRTLNGEWLSRNEAVQSVMDRFPDAGLSRYLVSEPLNYADSVREKATADAILTLQECALKMELDTVMTLWKSTLDEAELERCRSRYTAIDRDIKILKKRRLER